MTENKDAFDGVIGGRRLSKRNTRTELIEPDDLEISSELDRKIVRLMILHPDLVKFRNLNSLKGLDEQTKEALLEDMHEALGIDPLT